MLLGEPEPDENDPKYQERKKRDKEAGAKFARALRLDKAALYVQKFAETHNKLFMVIVFTFIFCSLGLNIFRMCSAYNYRHSNSSVIQRQERELHLNRHKNLPPLKQQLK